MGKRPNNFLVDSHKPSVKIWHHRFRAISRRPFYVLLSALVLLDLLTTAFRYGQNFRAVDAIPGIPPLDSFSQPSVAAGLLKSQTEALFATFTELRNEADYPGTPQLHHGLQAPTAADFKLKDLSPQGISVVQRLEALHATIQDLKLDVNQKLLVVYVKNGNTTQLVNRFLELCHSCPERPELLEWVEPALDASDSCGRSEEVRDALEHLLRFHNKLPTTSGLRDRLQRWNAAVSGKRSQSE